MRVLPLFLLLSVLAGCLPASGPNTARIVASSRETAPPFVIIPLDAKVADYVSARPADSFAAAFGLGSAVPDLRIGIGDVMVVTIFEAASGGLFSGDPGAIGGTKSVSLPPQPVAQDGTIGVPYVGRVRAAGLPPAVVQTNVEQALKDKAIEPQVVVTVSDSVSNFVTMAGEVSAPGRLPLTLDGTRVLDAIASMGGSRDADYNSFVRLTRGSRSATVSLARIVRDPAQNIYLAPRDLLYVYVDPQTYAAFGATLANASLPFQTDQLTLAQALGRVGGLNDIRADPKGVFVFRYEDPLILSSLGGAAGRAETAAGVPVVYNLDLKNPAGYFAAQRFLMRDNDILYVSNAPATDLQKFMSIMTGGIGTAASAAAFSDWLRKQNE